MSGEFLTRVTVARTFVAVALDGCDRDGRCETKVQVSNLRRRVQVVYDVNGLRSLALTPSGSIVAITSSQVVTGRSGNVTVVGEGADIDAASLAVTCQRIYWMQGGTPRTALVQ
jgi:uncharacterized ParB-like nuclease family protein